MTVDGDDLRSVLYRSLVEDAFDTIVTIDDAAEITYANAALSTWLGYKPAEVIGRSVLDFLHPDEVERAANDLAAQAEHGAPQGTSNFRLRHADGSWVSIDVVVNEIWDGERTVMGMWGRNAADRRATEDIVVRLLDGGSRGQLLEPVCELFDWRLNGTRVGITWTEDDKGRQFVSTDLPAEMVGAARPGLAPWEYSRTYMAEQHLEPDDLAEAGCYEMAGARGLQRCWVVPVPDADGRDPALITVWAGPVGQPTQIHAYGMGVARTFVELILRWCHQTDRLEQAVHTDELTGMANRKAFFAQLDVAEGRGAVLYCDLDGFKLVNDNLGHAAGDAVLVQVGARLRQAVRTGDLVARIGGDEFAVLCAGATRAEADRLAGRIQEQFAEALVVGGRTVGVGISIGVAEAPDRLTTDTLEAADQALYQAKAQRGRPSS
jgi:diguanylate cyclase (GGDEF)-like protein/PAS domain S-box-containing protein